MQISSIHYAPVATSVTTAPTPAASQNQPQDTAAASDSVCLTEGVDYSDAATQSALSKLSEDDISAKVLGDIFKEAEKSGDALAAGEGSAAEKQVGLAPEKRVVGGFYLADGSPAVGEGIASSAFGPEVVPTREDVAGYQLISHDAAVADYNENVKSHLNPVERSSIKAYCTFAYELMNGYMLGLKGSPTGAVRAVCRCMTKALQRFDVPSGSFLYRTANINELRNYVTPEDFAKFEKIDKAGRTEELAKILDARLTGTETHRKSFISTTIDDKFDFEDKPKVATRMYVGENVHGVYVAADKRLSPLPEEKEFLLAPDTKVTVLGVDYDPKNKGMVMHVLLGDLPQGGQALA